MGWLKEKPEDTNGTLVFAIIVIVIFTIMVTSSIINNKEPHGIGGFVYKEIRWEDQTINVIQENCHNGLYIDTWSEERDFLYCYSQECKGAYCKEKIIRFT